MSGSLAKTAGDSTALTCSVSQPTGLSVDAVLQWTKDGVPQTGEPSLFLYFSVIFDVITFNCFIKMKRFVSERASFMVTL